MHKIRKARRDDWPELIKYGELFWQSTRYYQIDGVPFSPESTEAQLDWLDNPDNGFILVVVDRDDKVKGYGLVATYPLIWDFSKKCAGELAFYIDEELRGSGMGVKLLRAMEVFARNRDCVYMAMISMTHSMDAGPLYEKMGYIETETTYTKEL